MPHAELCPVCSGTGKCEGETCHGCVGLGWVVVGIECSAYPQYPTYPVHPSTPWDSPWYSYTTCLTGQGTS